MLVRKNPVTQTNNNCTSQQEASNSSRIRMVANTSQLHVKARSFDYIKVDTFTALIKEAAEPNKS